MTELDFVNQRLQILEQAFVETVAILLRQNDPMLVRSALAMNMKITADRMTDLTTKAKLEPKLQASKIVHNLH